MVIQQLTEDVRYLEIMNSRDDRRVSCKIPEKKEKRVKIQIAYILLAVELT